MNVRLSYRDNTKSYSEHFSKFTVKVTLSDSGRVHIAFHEKTESKSGAQYASFSLPPQKARQLGDAVNAVCWGDAEPVEFSIDE